MGPQIHGVITCKRRGGRTESPFAMLLQRSGKGSVRQSERQRGRAAPAAGLSCAREPRTSFWRMKGDWPEQFTDRRRSPRGKQRHVTTHPNWVTARMEGGSKNRILPHLPTGKGCANNEAVAGVAISCHQSPGRTGSCVTTGLQKERGSEKPKSSY